MLWKKESNKRDALYVHLFPEGGMYWRQKWYFLTQFDKKEPRIKKSNALALQKRNEGNDAFRARKWLDALELYGESLRWAEPKSEHISLAYANRATCFLNLKLYANCLKDIELAIKAGYPEHLMPKLDLRKIKCLDQMQDDPQNERMPSITEPDDRFPCLANVATVHKNESGRYSVVAKSDIDVGQVVVVEKRFHNYQTGNFGTMCNVCFKEFGNLVPCDTCSDAMFCPECQGDALHVHECGLHYSSTKALNYLALKMVRFLLQTLKVFPDVDDFMAFVDHCRENSTSWSANLLDQRAKYQSIFGRINSNQDTLHENTLLRVYMASEAFLRIPHAREMFKSKKHLRFLMHLITHYANLSEMTDSSSVGAVAMDTYFKHSCDPNLHQTIHHGHHILYSIKPIKRGEQLTICRIPRDSIDSEGERDKELLGLGIEKCDCTRCNGNEASPTQRTQIYTDPSFAAVISRFGLLKLNVKRVNLSMQMDDCMTFLRTYGRLGWCAGIETIAHHFALLQSIHLIHDFDHPLALARFQKDL